MIYKGYLIEEDSTGYAPKHLRFNFFDYDGETFLGNGESLEECKKEIDSMIIEDIKEKLEYNFGW